MKKSIFMKLAFLGGVSFFLFFQCHSQNECGTLPRVKYPNENLLFRTTDLNKIDTIPVIFHVLYKNDSENLADSLLFSLFSTTAKDLLAQNLDLSEVSTEFRDMIGNPNICLRIATRLPNGETTSGIIRKRTQTKVFRYDRREAFIESKIIDSRKYLNVYVCDVNKGTNAFTPTKGNPIYDGIVIDYKKVRSGSRTLTHEIGHWLGLLHIFQGGCGSTGDGVTDTPKQKKSVGCPRYPKVDCTSPAMFMNYMDYSTCRFFFTVGQAKRMKEYILKYKNFE
jgi:hypothetical protein